MSDTKWTPGPWRINESGSIGNQVEADSGQRTYDSDNGYRGVALFMACTSSRNYYEEEANRLANAHLIAAAPDLYAALEALFADYKALADSGDAGNWSLEDTQEGKQVIAALAKARGESPA